MKRSPEKILTPRTRLLIAVIVGIVVGVGLIAVGQARYALLGAWDTAALLYVVSVLFGVLGFNAHDTKVHALRENPGRVAADVLLLTTSVASLAAVGILVFLANDATGITKAVDITLGLLSVVISWSVVHTLFMLKYARLYYGDPEGGINFNEQSKPRYADFAYVAFTIGMAFQVSDTALETKEMRATALHQALLAYVFGTVIIATTINTLASLS